MSLLSKFLYRRPPDDLDGLFELADRIYVFDSCFSTEVLPEGQYQLYLQKISKKLQENFPESSFLAFNFREGERRSQFSQILCEYDISVMDYPKQYEGCPLLPLSLVHSVLRLCESWLTPGNNNQDVVLLHCERGGWPILAFLLASILIYKKLYTGELKTLEYVYRKAPEDLSLLLSPLNPYPSQLRYLQYISRRNLSEEWPPPERALSLDCLILHAIPNFDNENGCRPVIRIYGRNLHSKDGLLTEMLYSTPRRGRNIRHYRQKHSDVIMIDSQCLVEGDVVLECLHLDIDSEREVMMFRIMFNTAFIRSNILMLNCDNLDTLWDSKARFPKGFRAEVLFGDVDNISTPKAPTTILNGEEKGGLPIEAFNKVQKLFNGIECSDGGDNTALRLVNLLSHLNDAKELSTYSSTFDSEGDDNPSSVANSLDVFESERGNHLPNASAVNFFADESAYQNSLSDGTSDLKSLEHHKTSETVDSSVSSSGNGTSESPNKDVSIAPATDVPQAPAPPPPPPPPPPSFSTSSGGGSPTPPSDSLPTLSSTIPPPPPFARVSVEKSSASPSPPPPPPPPPPPSSVSSPSPLPRTSVASKGPPSPAPPPSKKTSSMRLHWVKVGRPIQGSLWDDKLVQEGQSGAPELDISELKSLLSAASVSDNASKGGARRGSKFNKPKKVQLVDLPRAYICEIVLKRMKIPVRDMLNTILALDASALDIDQVKNLITCCPTNEEMKTLKNYTGNKEMLGKCELFFMELMKVPRVESKLRVFAFTITFTSQVSDLRRSLSVINDATNEVKESVKLRQIMHTILTLGNALNQGTARGSAIGFKLDSLLKLSDTLAGNNKMTLMHYLCKLLAEKTPELLDFDKDLVHLEAASKIQVKTLTGEMQAVSKGLEKVVWELVTSENDGAMSAVFQKASKGFLDTAEAEMRALISFYAEVGRNTDSLSQYYGEDPVHCPFEQVIEILVVFAKMFKKACDENERQADAEKKRLEREGMKLLKNNH